MAEALKILAQASPPAATLMALSGVPSTRSWAVSSISICNRNATDQTFSISLAIGGAPDADQQYLYDGAFVSANTTFIATVGLSLAGGDVINVMASATRVAFQVFGVEVS